MLRDTRVSRVICNYLWKAGLPWRWTELGAALFDWNRLVIQLLSRFSRVQLCATPQVAAHQAPPSLGFSRQEHWSGLPFPSPMHESEKWKWSHSVMSNSLRPHGLQPTRLLRPWDFPGKSAGVGCHCHYSKLKLTRVWGIFFLWSWATLREHPPQ